MAPKNTNAHILLLWIPTVRVDRGRIRFQA